MFKTNISKNLYKKLGDKIHQHYFEESKLVEKIIFNDYELHTIIVFRYTPLSDGYWLCEISKTLHNGVEIWSKGEENLEKPIDCFKDINLSIIKKLKRWGFDDILQIVLANRGVKFSV